MLKKNYKSDFCKLLNEPALELIQKTVFDERTGKTGAREGLILLGCALNRIVAN
jgi:hypothetical protein